MSANTQLSDMDKSLNWWIKLHGDKKTEYSNSYFPASDVLGLSRSEILHIWQQETKPKSDREKALAWWNGLHYTKREHFIMMEKLGQSEFTESDIENIWRKETSPTTTVNEGEEGLIITTVAQFKLMPLGTKIYRILGIQLNCYYYAGINPMSDKSIMLISGNSVQDIKSIYLGNSNIQFYTDYNMACNALLDSAKKEVENIKKIYIDSQNQKLP